MVKRGVLFLLYAVVIASFCSINTAFAEGAEISIDVSDATLQLTVPGTANIVLNPGTVSSFGTAEVIFNVATNNQTGYTVTMSVPQTEMLHSTVSSANIPTLESATSEANFPVNKWGYKTTGEYNPVNLSNTDAAWEYESPTNGHNHSLTLAAKVDGTTMAGAYTNTLTFTAVVNPNSLKDTVIFNANNADATGSMSSQFVYQGASTALKKNTFSVEGKRFAGWSTTASGLDGIYYGDGSAINPEITDESKTIQLYAIWADSYMPEGYNSDDEGGDDGETIKGTTLARAYELYYISKGWGMYVPIRDGLGQFTGEYKRATSAADYEGIAAKEYRFAMQDMNPSICNSATNVGHQVSLLDLRDNKTYYATRLADGNCWMTKNLDLDISSQRTYTHSDTDLGFGASTITTWTPSNSTMASNETWVSNYNEMISQDPGILYYYTTNEVRHDSSPDYITYTSIAECEQDGHTDCDHYHLGNYYNFCASTASSNCYNNAYEATESICPAGWRLPVYVNETFTEYGGLLYKHGIISSPADNQHYKEEEGFNVVRAKPLYFISQLEYTLGNGSWTESNAFFFFNSGTISANRYGRYNRGAQFTVRCLARKQ